MHITLKSRTKKGNAATEWISTNSLSAWYLITCMYTTVGKMEKSAIKSIQRRLNKFLFKQNACTPICIQCTIILINTMLCVFQVLSFEMNQMNTMLCLVWILSSEMTLYAPSFIWVMKAQVWIKNRATFKGWTSTIKRESIKFPCYNYDISSVNIFIIF